MTREKRNGKMGWMVMTVITSMMASVEGVVMDDTK